jgi:hypothetical protein
LSEDTVIEKNKYTRNGVKYFYFVASLGHEQMARAEVELVKKTADFLRILDSSIILCFRPYPMLKKKGIYDDLKSIENLEFDDYDSDSEKSGFILDEDGALKKMNLINYSLGVIHCGTTVGIETCFFDVPIIYITLTGFDKALASVYRQYHLEKYYKLKYCNVVSSEMQLSKMLKGIISNPGDSSFLQYNLSLRERFLLKSNKEMADVFADTWKKSLQ